MTPATPATTGATDITGFILHASTALSTLASYSSIPTPLNLSLRPCSVALALRTHRTECLNGDMANGTVQ